MAAVTIAILADASQATSEMGKVGGAADGMATDLDKADKASRNIGENLDGVASKSSQAAGGLGDLGGALSTIGGDTAIGKLGGAMEGIAPLVMGITGAMDLLTVALDTNVGSWIKNAAASVASKVATVAGTVATAAATAGQWLLNIALSANPIGLIIIGVLLLVGALILLWKKSETFRAIVTAAWEGIKTAALAVFNFLKAYFITMFNVYKKVFTTAWTIIKTVVSVVFNGIKAVISTVLNAVKTGISNFVAGVKIIWSGITFLWTKAKEVVDKVVGYFKGLGSKIGGAISGVVTKLTNIGKDMMHGLVAGIDAGLQWVKDKIGGLGKLIPDWLKKVLGIKSPSTVMADIGTDAIAGLVKGLDDGQSDVEKSMNAIGDAVSGVVMTPTVDMQGEVTPVGSAGAAPIVYEIHNHFTGVVGDPIAVANQIERTFIARINANGRPIRTA